MEKQLTLKGKGARLSFLFGSVAEKEELKNYQDLIGNQWELLNLLSKACLNHGIFIHTIHHHGISSAPIPMKTVTGYWKISRPYF
jgi:ABC-type polysaccharide/polyol phosphate export permease